VATIVDVREASEWDQGHIPGAHHVSKSYIEQQIEAIAPDRDAEVILYCAGGVGSPAALYLAAAGVGTIGLVDFDIVDLSNLQRQIVHTTARVGERKVESARIAINALNPDVTVIEHEEMLVAANVERIIAGYDVILDGTDTFETRYILNDAAVAAGIPVVHASVFRFEGQLTTFVPFEGPCYRCLYPTPPPPELAPGCSVAGVLGVVPGILGMLQTNEALKVLLGIGTTLSGRLLLFDALETEFTELRLRRDPACPVCSDEAVEARAAGRPLATTSVGADAPFLLTTTGLAGSVSPEARA
jgi:molybdopterin/thiamine biosynthesis adenylyltransferase